MRGPRQSLGFSLYLCSVKIKEVLSALERFAPLPLQESWDNAGLQVGLTETEVSGALLC
ncbi:MAG: Nif3-like dinuclear metal center hexameric protein, partial [Prevotella sp.]|nr:Nif3-like dinuclear metal center hexameric protein [Prevotella sp.]